MKRNMKSGFIAMLAAVCVLATQPLGRSQGAAGAAGTWDMTIESPLGKRTTLLVLRQEGEKWFGAMKSQQGERAVDNLAVKVDEISFTVTIPFQGQDMVITYKGTVEKDSMKGAADFGGLASGEWAAARHQEGTAADVAAPVAAATTAPASGSPEMINISGAWDFAVETAAGSGTPTFTFKQDGKSLTGTYKGLFGTAAVSGTLEGSDIKFSIKVDFQGQNFEVVYTGKVEGKDAMKGAVRMGDLGEGTWTAKKQP